MYRKIISLITLMLFCLFEIVYADVPIDNFENYENTVSMQTTWLWNWTPPSKGATLDHHLDTLDNPMNKVMRVDFSFPGGSDNAWGKIGREDAWNWTGQTGVKFWIKASTTGDPSQNYRVRFHESDPAQSWGDKWESPYMPISDLDTNGQYVTINFSDFTDFGGSGGTKDNGTLELEDIKAFYICPAYSGTASSGGTTTLWVDDFSTIGDSTGISAMFRFPYLQNVTQNSVDVMWGTGATTGALYWGPSPGNYTGTTSSITFDDTGGKQVHTATITGLTPGEVVYYYVISGNDTVGLDDSSYYAAAAPDENTDFRFIAYGDSKYNSAYLPTYHGHVIDAMIPHDPAIVIHGGDIAEQGLLNEFDRYFFDFAAPLIKNTPVFTTIGNHEVRYNSSDYEDEIQNYRDFFSLPSNNAENIEDYYSFDYGSVHFISLNTQWLKPGTGNFDSDRAATMKTWLQNDLSSTSKPWKVVFFHKQAFLDYVVDQGWESIFENNGVDLVFYGHGHSYISHYRNGVTYVMTGGGGARLGPPNLWGWPNNRLYAFSDYHFIDVDVTSDKLFLNVYDDGNILRHWIEVNADGTVDYPALVSIDDFEIYNSTEELQVVWDTTYIPSEFDDLGVTFESSLATGGDTDTSNVMQLDFSFPEGSEGAWGAVGRSGSWNWSTHNGINLWIKAITNGDVDQSYQIHLLENNGGDKWVATKPLSELDANGQYVSVYFNDFEWYGSGHPDSSLADGLMDLNNISAFYIGAKASSGPAAQNSTATLLVDNISAFLISITSTHLDDNFDNYANNSALEAKWDMVWASKNTVNMSRNLDVTGGVNESQAMKLEITVDSGTTPTSGLGVNWEPCIWGITGYITAPENQTDITGYQGVKLWLKPGNITGDQNSYFMLNLIEDEAVDTEEKWMSPKVYLNTLNPNGGYVYFAFNEFYQYNTNSSELMELDKIKLSYLFLAYRNTVTLNSSASVLVDDITYINELAIDSGENIVPHRFNLHQNYPNPFNPTTTIRYDLAYESNIQLIVYDIVGREIIKLVDNKESAGTHNVKWNGRDKYGLEVASGVYIYQLKSEKYNLSRKLLLIK